MRVRDDLIDAEKMAKQYPDSFTIPPLERRRGLRVGDDVKVCIAHRERFWCRITARFDVADGSVIYRALPEENGETEAEEIAVEPRHVYDIDDDDDADDVEPAGRSS